MSLQELFYPLRPESLASCLSQTNLGFDIGGFFGNYLQMYFSYWEFQTTPSNAANNLITIKGVAISDDLQRDASNSLDQELYNKQFYS